MRRSSHEALVAYGQKCEVVVKTWEEPHAGGEYTLGENWFFCRSYRSHMLVLTRKPKQVIEIGDDIRIVIVSVDGDQVRVGIEAPRAVPVHRSEVREMLVRDALPAG